MLILQQQTQVLSQMRMMIENEHSRHIQSVESFSTVEDFFERWKRDEGGKTTKRKTPKRQERRVMSNRESTTSAHQRKRRKNSEHT
jgi:hypothetical protein